jgi:hypothetical protein
MDGLKELVPTIVKSINLKALFLCYGLVYGSDVIELLLQGLYTNHTIVMVNFVVTMHLVPDLVEKLMVMLYQKTSLKRFKLATLGKGEFNLPIFGFGKTLGMNHTLEILQLDRFDSLVELDLEELIQPLIMDENGNQVNYTFTSLTFMSFHFMSSFGASIVGMLRRNSSIKHLNLKHSLTTKSHAQELI